MGEMSRYVRLLGAAGVLALGFWVGAAVWADDDRHVARERVRIVVVDDGGNRHEELHEFDADNPRAFLGVRLERVRDGGARVEHVVDGSAAERAGLREGDVIVGIDGAPVESPWDLTHELLTKSPGDRVDIELEREGDRERITAELDEHPDGERIFAYGFGGFDLGAIEDRLEDLDIQLEDLRLDEMMGQLHEQLEDLDFRLEPLRGNVFRWRAAKPRLGVELVGVTPELREHLGAFGDEGVLVGKVIPGTPAAEHGVEVGDLIVALDGVTIADSHTLRRELRERAGLTIDVEVIREGSRMHLSVYIPEDEIDRDATFEEDGPARPATRVSPQSRT